MSIVFGKKLKEIRTKSKLTQSNIAAILKMNKATVCKWEKGELEPDIETLKKLAMILDVSVDELIDFNKYDYILEKQTL